MFSSTGIIHKHAIELGRGREGPHRLDGAHAAGRDEERFGAQAECAVASNPAIGLLAQRPSRMAMAVCNVALKGVGAARLPARQPRKVVAVRAQAKENVQVRLDACRGP